MNRIDAHILTYWRIRLTALCLLCPVFIALFFSAAPVWRTCLTVGWMLSYVFFYVFYYPVKYRKLSYMVNRQCLVIHCGVFYNRVKGIELRNIQHVSTSASPLLRVMGLCTVYISCAGGMLYIPGLKKESARALCARLLGDKKR